MGDNAPQDLGAGQADPVPGDSTTGPTGSTTKTGEKAWERAWDRDEMRKNAGNWSLAGDAGMLLHLQSFSQQLLARTHDMQQKLNELNRATKLTGVQMSNVFNEFMMLANNQFVENRVYDEDVNVEEVIPVKEMDKQEKTQEQKEAELIPKINNAITLGLNVIDSAFEKLDVNEANSSDEEEDTHQRTEMLLEPKDPYLSRPLPHLIGSVMFMHEEHVGLVDMPSEEEEEAQGEESISESGSESEEETQKQPAAHRTTTQPTVDWSESETESEGDLFDAEKKPLSDEEEIFPENEDHAAEIQDENDPSRFTDELANKLRAGATTKSTKQESRPVKKRNSQCKQDTREADLFSEVRPNEDLEDPVDDDSSLFRPSSGKYSTHGGLFDDDEEEGGLFGSAAPEKTKQPQSKNSHQEQQPPKKSESVTKPKSRPAGGLFEQDQSDGSDDDLFAVANKSTKKSSGTGSAARASALFADQSDEDSEAEKTLTASAPQKHTKKPSSPKKKLPAGAVSIFGAGGNPVVQALRKQHADYSTDESNTSTEDEQRSSQHDTDTSSSGPVDITAAISKAPPSGYRKKTAIRVLPVDSSQGGSALFGDDKEPIKTEKKKDIKKTTGGGGLFDDEDDDLFSSASKPTQSSNKQETDKKDVSKPQPPAAQSLFSADDDEDDLFAVSSKPANKNKGDSKSKKNVLSLFDDEDDGDIFAVPQLQNIKKPSVSQDFPKERVTENKAKVSSHTAFEDEDFLFAAAEDNPTIDLFGANSPLSSPTKSDPKPTSKTSAPQPVPSKSDKASKSQSLFDVGKGEEEDMFRDLNLPNKKKTEVAEKLPPSAASIGQGAKPKVKQPSASKKVDSLFDDDEDLFASPSTKQTKPIKPAPKQASQATKPASTITPASRKTPNRTPLSDPLFGEPLEPSDIIKPEKKVVKPPPKSQDQVEPKQPQPPVTADKNKSPVSESSDEDLFPDSPSPEKKEDKKPSPTRAKPPGPFRPPGAVSMFGGLDPSAVLGTRPKHSKPSPPQEEDDVSGGEVIGQETVGAESNSNQSAVVIDSVGFDQPVQSAVLQSSTKTRAKMSSVRRPPSRRNRPQATIENLTKTTSSPNNDQRVKDFFIENPPSDSQIVNGMDDLPVDVNMNSGHKSDGFPERKRGGTDNTHSENTQSVQVVQEDIFAPSNDDIFSPMKQEIFSPKTSHERHKEANTGRKSDSVNDIFASDVHETKEKKPPPDELSGDVLSIKSTTGSQKLKTDNDLVDSASENQTVFPSTNNSLKKTKALDPLLDEDDDIFGESILNKSKKTQKTKPHSKPDLLNDDLFPKTSEKDIFSKDIEDDLFGDSLSNKKQKQIGKTPIRAEEDDIFSNSLSKSEPKTKVETDDLDIFGSKADTENDIFGSDSSIPKPEKKKDSSSKSKSAQKAIDDIFADDTDIFANLPKSKPKAAKTKKKELSNQPSIFNDDIDDLFSSVSSTKTSAVKPKTKTQSKATKSAVEDIFGDDTPSIFDDPLSATRK